MVPTLSPPHVTLRWHVGNGGPSRPLLVRPTLPSLRIMPKPRILATSLPSGFNTQEPNVIEAAWQILDNYNNNDMKRKQQPSLETEGGVVALRASVLVAVEASVAESGCEPLLGICAHNSEEATRALCHWTEALGYQLIMPQSEQDLKNLSGPVYVKFNAVLKQCYAKPYTGTFRGVILQIGQKQVAHLPLLLFEQERFWSSSINSRVSFKQASLVLKFSLFLVGSSEMIICSFLFYLPSHSTYDSESFLKEVCQHCILYPFSIKHLYMRVCEREVGRGGVYNLVGRQNNLVFGKK